VDEEKHKCPPHFWIVDEKNVGRCKYCPVVRNFGKEQEVWFRKHKEARAALSAIGGMRRRRPWNK